MDDMQNKVEAVLFITGSFMTLEDIGKSAGIGSEGIVKEAVEGLKKSYDERQGSLEIIENEGRYKIALRKDYVQFSTKLLSSTELDRSTQETLAIIAYKQPILQADLIKVRGNGAYDHIHILKDLQFIVSEKFGRTRKLKLAPKFFDYFDIAGDMLKAKCDEIGQKVGTVERIEKKEQVSLVGYKGEANVQENPTPPKESPSEAKSGDDDDDEVNPDPEDIQPDKPEPHDPRKKPDEPEPEEPDDNPGEPDEESNEPGDGHDDNPDDNLGKREEQAEPSEDEKA